MAEDKFLQAELLSAGLQAAGAVVIGPVATLAGAMIAIETSRIDAAILDVNLHGGTSFAVADKLRSRALPFVFVTGFDPMSIPVRHRGIACLPKPASPLPTIAALLATA